jgi:hypothetical protein
MGKPSSALHVARQLEVEQFQDPAAGGELVMPTKNLVFG